MADKNETNERTSPEVPLSAAARRGLSVLLIAHLTAVFIAPFTFATSSGPGMASPAAVGLMDALRPYIDAAFLNHGYFFFAPNPGPSHVVRYRVEFDDGRPPVEGVFPNLRQHQPRLFYHRHFMLSEQMNAMFAPPRPPVVDGPEDPLMIRNWRDQRARYEAVWSSFERHLLAKHGGSRVTMERVEHRLLDIPEVRAGKPLSAADSYIVLPEDPPPTTGPRRAGGGR